jgi:hypothetical protein
MMTYTPFRGRRIARSGRIARPASEARFEDVVRRAGGTVVELDDTPDLVVTFSRPATKRIATLGIPQVLDWSAFVVACTPPPAWVTRALRDDPDALRVYVGDLRRSTPYRVSVAGERVEGPIDVGRMLDVTGADLGGWRGGETFLAGRDVRFAGAHTVQPVQLRVSDSDLGGWRCDGDLHGRFERCTARGARFRGTLSGTWSDVDLRGADLRDAVLAFAATRVVLDGLDLTSTRIRCDPRGLSAAGARMRPAPDDRLYGMDLRDVDFGDADLTGLVLQRGSAPGARLDGIHGQPLWVEPRATSAPQWGDQKATVPLYVDGVRWTASFTFRRLDDDRFVLARGDVEQVLPDAAVLMGAIAALDGDVLWDEVVLAVWVSGREGFRSDHGLNARARAWLAETLGIDPPGEVAHPGPSGVAADPIADLGDDWPAGNLTDEDFAVLADWLSERGDPRGALIVEELAAPAAERPAIRKRHLEQHSQTVARSTHRLQIAIRCAFVDHLTIHDKRTAMRTIDGFLAHSCSRFLTRLTVHGALPKPAMARKVLDARAIRWLSSLRDGDILTRLGTLSGVQLLVLGWSGAVDLSLAPDLEALVLRGPEVQVTGTARPLALGFGHDRSLEGIDPARLRFFAGAATDALLDAAHLETVVGRVEPALAGRLRARGVTVRQGRPLDALHEVARWYLARRPFPGADPMAAPPPAS